MHGVLVAFGIIILVLGVVGYLYYEPVIWRGYEVSRNYPYRNLGLILAIGGSICTGIGVVYSPKQQGVTQGVPQG